MILLELPCAFGWDGDARCREDPDVPDIETWCAPCQIRESVSKMKATCPACKAYGECPDQSKKARNHENIVPVESEVHP